MNETDRQLYMSRAKMIIERERAKPVVEELDSD
jgi:hypothetical protein